MGPIASWCPGTPILYDAEAVQAARETLRLQLAGTHVSEDERERAIDDEVRNLEGVSAIVTVSHDEGRRLEAAGAPVYTIIHQVETRPTWRAFAERRGFLFVGAFSEQSPNSDSVLWFCAEVLPALRRQLSGCELIVAGHAPPPAIRALADADITILPDVDDLRPLYDRVRVAIAPTRFAAGVPLKVLHAAAAGVPVVCTRLLARQLGWSEGTDLLAADAPIDFANACVALHEEEARWAAMRAAALGRIRNDYSAERFSAAVAHCLDAVLSTPSEGNDSPGRLGSVVRHG
jgi:glycosyltransferase involved in cell wall biosynthesis